MQVAKGKSSAKRVVSASIPEALQKSTAERIRVYAQKHFAGKYTELDIRFDGQLCYVDCYEEPKLPPGRNAWIDDPEQYLARLRCTPIQLCRLQYLGNANRWGFEIFSYSSEQYEPNVFPSGNWQGAPEQAFALAARLYLS